MIVQRKDLGLLFVGGGAVLIGSVNLLSGLALWIAAFVVIVELFAPANDTEDILLGRKKSVSGGNMPSHTQEEE